eukprot:GHVQ01022676.1.p1 GENE.GHVQ01022676.1~~GHVQ01022676.1.p1  ORF type:complete len:2516 (+),score=343.30 GHVQ01022676.1:311-7858(+)
MTSRSLSRSFLPSVLMLFLSNILSDSDRLPCTSRVHHSLSGLLLLSVICADRLSPFRHSFPLPSIPLCLLPFHGFLISLSLLLVFLVACFCSGTHGMPADLLSSSQASLPQGLLLPLTGYVHCNVRMHLSRVISSSTLSHRSHSFSALCFILQRTPIHCYALLSRPFNCANGCHARFCSKKRLSSQRILQVPLFRKAEFSCGALCGVPFCRIRLDAIASGPAVCAHRRGLKFYTRVHASLADIAAGERTGISLSERAEDSVSAMLPGQSQWPTKVRRQDSLLGGNEFERKLTAVDEGGRGCLENDLLSRKPDRDSDDVLMEWRMKETDVSDLREDNACEDMNSQGLANQQDIETESLIQQLRQRRQAAALVDILRCAVHSHSSRVSTSDSSAIVSTATRGSSCLSSPLSSRNLVAAFYSLGVLLKQSGSVTIRPAAIKTSHEVPTTVLSQRQQACCSAPAINTTTLQPPIQDTGQGDIQPPPSHKTNQSDCSVQPSASSCAAVSESPLDDRSRLNCPSGVPPLVLHAELLPTPVGPATAPNQSQHARQSRVMHDGLMDRLFEGGAKHTETELDIPLELLSDVLKLIAVQINILNPSDISRTIWVFASVLRRLQPLTLHPFCSALSPLATPNSTTEHHRRQLSSFVTCSRTFVLLCMRRCGEVVEELSLRCLTWAIWGILQSLHVTGGADQLKEDLRGGALPATRGGEGRHGGVERSTAWGRQRWRYGGNAKEPSNLSAETLDGGISRNNVQPADDDEGAKERVQGLRPLQQQTVVSESVIRYLSRPYPHHLQSLIEEFPPTANSHFAISRKNHHSLPSPILKQLASFLTLVTLHLSANLHLWSSSVAVTVPWLLNLAGANGLPAVTELYSKMLHHFSDLTTLSLTIRHYGAMGRFLRGIAGAVRRASLKASGRARDETMSQDTGGETTAEVGEGESPAGAPYVGGESDHRQGSQKGEERFASERFEEGGVDTSAEEATGQGLLDGRERVVGISAVGGGAEEVVKRLVEEDVVEAVGAGADSEGEGVSVCGVEVDLHTLRKFVKTVERWVLHECDVPDPETNIHDSASSNNFGVRADTNTVRGGRSLFGNSTSRVRDKTQLDNASDSHTVDSVTVDAVDPLLWASPSSSLSASVPPLQFRRSRSRIDRGLHRHRDIASISWSMSKLGSRNPKMLCWALSYLNCPPSPALLAEVEDECRRTKLKQRGAASGGGGEQTSARDSDRLTPHQASGKTFETQSQETTSKQQEVVPEERGGTGSVTRTPDEAVNQERRPVQSSVKNGISRAVDIVSEAQPETGEGIDHGNTSSGNSVRDCNDTDTVCPGRLFDDSFFLNPSIQGARSTISSTSTSPAVPSRPPHQQQHQEQHTQQQHLPFSDLQVSDSFLDDDFLHYTDPCTALSFSTATSSSPLQFPSPCPISPRSLADPFTSDVVHSYSPSSLPMNLFTPGYVQRAGLLSDAYEPSDLLAVISEISKRPPPIHPMLVHGLLSHGVRELVRQVNLSVEAMQAAHPVLTIEPKIPSMSLPAPWSTGQQESRSLKRTGTRLHKFKWNGSSMELLVDKRRMLFKYQQLRQQGSDPLTDVAGERPSEDDTIGGEEIIERDTGGGEYERRGAVAAAAAALSPVRGCLSVDEDAMEYNRCGVSPKMVKLLCITLCKIHGGTEQSLLSNDFDQLKTNSPSIPINSPPLATASVYPSHPASKMPPVSGEQGVQQSPHSDRDWLASVTDSAVESSVDAYVSTLSTPPGMAESLTADVAADLFGGYQSTATPTGKKSKHAKKYDNKDVSHYTSANKETHRVSSSSANSSCPYLPTNRKPPQQGGNHTQQLLSKSASAVSVSGRSVLGGAGQVSSPQQHGCSDSGSRGGQDGVYLLGGLAELIASYCLTCNLTGFTVAQLATVCWGLATLKWQSQTAKREFFSNVANIIAPSIQEWPSRYLCTLACAFAKANYFDPHIFSVAADFLRSLPLPLDRQQATTTPAGVSPPWREGITASDGVKDGKLHDIGQDDDSGRQNPERGRERLLAFVNLPAEGILYRSEIPQLEAARSSPRETSTTESNKTASSDIDVAAGYRLNTQGNDAVTKNRIVEIEDMSAENSNSRSVTHRGATTGPSESVPEPLTPARSHSSVAQLRPQAPQTGRPGQRPSGGKEALSEEYSENNKSRVSQTVHKERVAEALYNLKKNVSPVDNNGSSVSTSSRSCAESASDIVVDTTSRARREKIQLLQLERQRRKEASLEAEVIAKHGNALNAKGQAKHTDENVTEMLRNTIADLNKLPHFSHPHKQLQTATLKHGTFTSKPVAAQPSTGSLPISTHSNASPRRKPFFASPFSPPQSTVSETCSSSESASMSDPQSVSANPSSGSSVLPGFVTTLPLPLVVPVPSHRPEPAPPVLCSSDRLSVSTGGSRDSVLVVPGLDEIGSLVWALSFVTHSDTADGTVSVDGGAEWNANIWPSSKSDSQTLLETQGTSEGYYSQGGKCDKEGQSDGTGKQDLYYHVARYVGQCIRWERDRRNAAAKNLR